MGVSSSSTLSSFLLTGNQYNRHNGPASHWPASQLETNKAKQHEHKPLLYYSIALVDQEHPTLLSYFFFFKLFFMCGCCVKRKREKLKI
jgi:hypothetical protein